MTVPTENRPRGPAPLPPPALPTASRHVGRQQLRLRRFLMGASCSAMFCLLELVLYLAGLMPGRAVLHTGALAGVGIAAFFLIFRLGLNQRAPDPSLTGPMMTVATAILLYTMAATPIAMQAFGVYLGVILLFGVFRFSGRTLLLYALGSLVAYGATVAWVALRSGRDESALAVDIARWLAFAGALPIFAWVGGHINRFRVRMDERKRFYQAVWDACSDVVVVVDRDGLVRHANPATQQVFGLPTAALLGRPLDQLEPPDERAGLGAFALAPRAAGATETAELVGWHADGRPLPLEVTVSNVVLDGHDVVVGFIRDITERKRAEERIRYVGSHDALTGLPNRALLKDRLAQAIAAARRSGSAVWVAFLDLDRFKLINDSLGHGAGDVAADDHRRPPARPAARGRHRRPPRRRRVRAGAHRDGGVEARAQRPAARHRGRRPAAQHPRPRAARHLQHRRRRVPRGRRRGRHADRARRHHDVPGQAGGTQRLLLLRLVDERPRPRAAAPRARAADRARPGPVRPRVPAAGGRRDPPRRRRRGAGALAAPDARTRRSGRVHRRRRGDRPDRPARPVDHAQRLRAGAVLAARRPAAGARRRQPLGAPVRRARAGGDDLRRARLRRGCRPTCSRSRSPSRC